MSLLTKLQNRYREFEARAAGRTIQVRRPAPVRPALTPERERALVQRIAELEPNRVTDPAVTVVIAAYNVAGYLDASVGSVLSQTLRNLEVLIVDDHSTDGTLETAVALAETDPRVRVLRTPTNSGGPGVPRNIGIRAAQAPFYTFLDGDDTLEVHACKNLLETAERTGSDLVVGRTERFHVSTGQSHRWYGHLFTERRERIRVTELPALLDDSIAAGKLYRRETTIAADNWLLEGVHYEDLVFTARAYAESTSISVIPTTTYLWHVYPEDERKSITAQKDDVDNLRHRLHALDRVDDALEGVAGEELRAQVKRKFLRHDARIYLNQAPLADDVWLASVCDLLRPRLEAMTAEDWALIDVYARLVYGAALSGNLEGVRQAVLFSIDGGTIAGRAVESAHRLFWQPAGVNPALPSAGSTAAALLDLTDDAILDIPPRGVKPCHVLTDLRVLGDIVLFEGRTHDLGDWFDGAELSLTVKLRKMPDRWVLPATILPDDGLGGIRWRAVWRATADLPLSRPQIWDLRVAVAGPGYETSALIHVSRFDLNAVDAVTVASATNRLFARSYRFYRTAKNHLALQLQGASGRLRLADRALGAASKTVKQSESARRRSGDRIALSRLYRQMRRLPIEKRAVFCESMLGKSAFDSPRAVAEEMLRIDPALTVHWVHSGPPPQLPPGFVPVRRWSPTYLRLAATARYIVDNQTLPAFFEKRPEQTYLQTWHGIPLKLMGLDAPDFKYADPDAQQALLSRAAQWDGLVSPCGYFEETFVRAYRYEGELLRGGTPRNDVLVRDADKRDEYKRRLGLPLDRTIVLYAPTFRSVTSPATVKPGQALDVQAWAEALGDSTYLLVRAHYLDRVRVPRALHQYALDVSDVPDVNDVFLAADVLITDYSSVMFDFATLRRPIAFYTYDLDDYASADRGMYFDLVREAPGPVARSFEELLRTVESMPVDRVQDPDAHERFVRRYSGDEDGRSAERAARWLLRDSDRTEGSWR